MEFWKEHKNDTPYCMCRPCYWAKVGESMYPENRYEAYFVYQTDKQLVRKPLRRPLEARVAEDINAIFYGSGFGGQEGEKEPHKGGKELPDLEINFDSDYKASMEYALRHCNHPDFEVDNPFAPSMITCDICHKVMTPEQFGADRERETRNFRRRNT